MAGNGLEVRIPFLDFDYVNLIMSIDPSLWMSNEAEAFSDAVSSKEVNWYKSIQTHAESIVTDEELSIIEKPE